MIVSPNQKFQLVISIIKLIVLCLNVEFATVDSFHLLVLYMGFGELLLCSPCWSLYAWSILMIIGFTSLLTVASLILPMKISMHRYKKLMMGPFYFARVPISQFWVHSSSSWIMDILSHKEQEAIWFSSWPN